MKTLIVGRFERYDQGETAAHALQQAGFPADEMSLFYINPQGQHDLHPLGGDEDESAGTHHAGSHAVASAAGGVGIGGLIGLATLPVLGPAGPLLGAAVGAYTGSLVGALGGMKQSEEAPAEIAARNANNLPPPESAIERDAEIAPPSNANEVAARQPGVMLAVAVATAEQQADAEILLGRYAYQVEQSEGDLRNGDWIDFDPLATLGRTG
ncbi:MAG TPA: hypothetical protein PLE48_10865 [Thiobacillus sp.]|nr:MAG: hypothetical protein B7Y50_06955 [Hydrogenophilales bacterium 28-61-11]OYZ56759.1 MAG: hypothetical protein B7Y21_10395 [Hydrogenophilales bacterium 16-61-112]OZA48908.1 MAG: hypothetical protein B7X81_03245 [Hydrogenophilales bacterium 17-61-76]HQT30008.1 hypothetical protein [Thiobacillus sp.]HQT70916.1 hypothetical protein [Thiobacillus sp.]